MQLESTAINCTASGGVARRQSSVRSRVFAARQLEDEARAQTSDGRGELGNSLELEVWKRSHAEGYAAVTRW